MVKLWSGYLWRLPLTLGSRLIIVYFILGMALGIGVCLQAVQPVSAMRTVLNIGHGNQQMCLGTSCLQVGLRGVMGHVDMFSSDGDG